MEIKKKSNVCNVWPIGAWYVYIFFHCRCFLPLGSHVWLPWWELCVVLHRWQKQLGKMFTRGPYTLFGFLDTFCHFSLCCSIMFILSLGILPAWLAFVMGMHKRPADSPHRARNADVSLVSLNKPFNKQLRKHSYNWYLTASVHLCTGS